MSGRTPHAGDDPHGDEPLVTEGTPLDAADAAIVLVHGRGATARGMLGMADEFDAEGVADLPLGDLCGELEFGAAGELDAGGHRRAGHEIPTGEHGEQCQQPGRGAPAKRRGDQHGLMQWSPFGVVSTDGFLAAV